MSIKHIPVGQLTFGSLLRTLHGLSGFQIRSQVELYKIFFESYCDYRGETDGNVWEPSQGSINRIFLDRQLPSWHQYQYYLFAGRNCIRDDINHYLQIAAVTAKQRRLHIDRLVRLVEESINIDNHDKDEIMRFNDVGEDAALEELLYRILHVLYHEPYSV